MSLPSEIVPRCPSCGGAEFEDLRGRKAALCPTCRSVERNRVARLFIDKHVKPQTGWRVLHIAPENDMARHLKTLCGDGYEPVDFDPEFYARRINMPVKGIDLCKDAQTLPSEHYDLVMHNHVLEHLPCNYTLVLQHLHRAVRKGGFHLFSAPIQGGHSREDFDPGMTPEQRKASFVQHDHIRRFGRADFDLTLGPILGLTSDYTLRTYFSAEELLGANVPERLWRCSGASVFMVIKA